MSRPLFSLTIPCAIPCAILCAASLLFSGCSSTKPAPTGMAAIPLDGLAEDEQSKIEASLEAASEARRAYADAREGTKVAGEKVGVALDELGESSRLIWSKRVTLAALQRDEGATRLDAVNAQYDELIVGERVARYRLALARRLHEQHALQERLALEKLRFADAYADVLRATAIDALDRPATDAVPLELFEEAVYFHEREVLLIEERLAQARSRTETARDDVERAAITPEGAPPSRR